MRVFPKTYRRNMRKKYLSTLLINSFCLIVPIPLKIFYQISRRWSNGWRCFARDFTAIERHQAAFLGRKTFRRHRTWQITLTYLTKPQRWTNPAWMPDLWRLTLAQRAVRTRLANDVTINSATRPSEPDSTKFHASEEISDGLTHLL